MATRHKNDRWEGRGRVLDRTSVYGKRLRLMLWVVVGLLLLTLAAGAFVVWKFRQRGPRDVRLYRKGHLLLRSNRTIEATAAFREAVRYNPKNLEAWEALAAVLTRQKEFDKAEEAIRQAGKAGLPETRSVMLRASLLLSEARHRMDSAGRSYSPADCESAIREEVDPAIALLEGLADKERKSGPVLNGLGEALEYKMRVLLSWRRAVEGAQENARKLQRDEELKKLDIELGRLGRELGATLRHAQATYGKAIDLDPGLVKPRLALARLYLLATVPRGREARDVLLPILEKDPGHAEALYWLAVAERTLGDDEKALAYLREIDPKAPIYEQARVYEADLLVKEGRFAEAGPITEEFYKRDPRNPQAAYLRAKVLLDGGNVEEATPLLQNIFGDEQLHWPEARLLLADTLMRTGKRQQALQAYRDVVTDVKTLFPRGGMLRREWLEILYKAYTSLAEELSSTVTDEGREYARKALRLFPMRADAYELVKKTFLTADPRTRLDWAVFLHAEMLFHLRRFDEAVAVVRADRKLVRDKLRADQLVAECLKEKGAFTEAVKRYEELLRENPDKATPLRLNLARLYRELGRDDEAVKVYRSIIRDEPENVQVIVRLAALLTNMGRAEEAKSLLGGAASGGVRAQALVDSLLYVYLREKKLDAAIELVKEQIKEQPDQANWLVVAARLCWAKGDRAAARSYYDKALKFDDPPPAAYRRVLLDIAEEKYAAARALADQALTENGGAKQANWRVFRIYKAVAWQASDPERAIAIFDGTLRDPRLPGRLKKVVRTMRAVVEAGEGRLGVPVAEASLDAGGGGARSLKREDLVRFLKELNKLDASRRRKAALAFNVMMLMMSVPEVREAKLQAAVIESALPDEPFPAVEKARLLMLSGARADALKECDRVLETHPDYITAWLLKADILVSLKKHDEAIAVYEKVREKNISDNERARIDYALGNLYGQAGRYDLATAHYKAAAQDEAFAAIAYNNLAWMLATEQNDPAGALPYAESAVKLAPNVSGFQDTLGWVHYLDDNVLKAIPYLEKAVKLNVRNPRIRYHLGMAYLKTGRRLAALNEFKQALALGRGLPEREASEAARVVQELSVGGR